MEAVFLLKVVGLLSSLVCQGALETG